MPENGFPPQFEFKRWQYNFFLSALLFFINEVTKKPIVDALIWDPQNKGGAF